MAPGDLHEPTLEEEGVLRPTHLEVNLDYLAHNLALIKARVGPARVMPILKANAYGHGLLPVARRMEAEGAHAIGVAYLEEALMLRRGGIGSPILVLGGILGSQIPLYLRHDISLTASSKDKLLAIEEAAAALGQRAKIHLKIDTGMERLGVHWYSAQPLLEASLCCPHVEVEGIFSHFASSDEPDLGPTRLQLERFLEVLRFYEDRSLPTPLRHISNSGAILQLPEAWLDLVRPGILLYGVLPAGGLAHDMDLRPALGWRSRVVYFKVAREGSPVSYGGTWRAPAMTRLVTIPVGYGDGYPRAMSGKAEILLHGRRYPVVGRICMDQVVVDIGWDSAWNDDEVTLLGESEGQRITVEELADWAGTIPYEILTGINTRVPRVYRGS